MQGNKSAIVKEKKTGPLLSAVRTRACERSEGQREKNVQIGLTPGTSNENTMAGFPYTLLLKI